MLRRVRCQALLRILLHNSHFKRAEFWHRTGSTIIAEGIERQEELETLLQLGVDHGQGYLLGRPEPGIGKKDSKSELRLVDKPQLRKVATKPAS